MTFKLGSVAKKDPRFDQARRRPQQPAREHWFDRWIRSLREERALRNRPPSCEGRGFHLWSAGPVVACKACKRTPIEVLKGYPKSTMDHRWPRREGLGL